MTNEKFYKTITSAMNKLSDMAEQQKNDKFVLLVHPDKIKEVRKAASHYNTLKKNLKIRKSFPKNLMRLWIWHIKRFFYLLLERIGLYE